MGAGADRAKGVACILVGSALWGASGSLTKLLRLHGFDIYDILAWRYFLGFLALIGLAAAVVEAPSLRADRRRLGPALLLALTMFGVNATFTWSNFFTTVANAVALSFTAPLFAAVLAWAILSGLYLKAHQGSVLALTEIPFSILIGMLALGEYPSLLSWAGVTLILVAGGLASLRPRARGVRAARPGAAASHAHPPPPEE